MTLSNVNNVSNVSITDVVTVFIMSCIVFTCGGFIFLLTHRGGWSSGLDSLKISTGSDAPVLNQQCGSFLSLSQGLNLAPSSNEPFK